MVNPQRCMLHHRVEEEELREVREKMANKIVAYILGREILCYEDVKTHVFQKERLLLFQVQNNDDPH